ncbi:Multicopper oxidase with three cupredoxin domains (includes cell division protein FtsP and spore coat protein CotA) [Tistlia consotensis]|uniref:Multicopper oxidase with three cupredoxin domains (Includes cell division protein FtsP and spore coat protein CotA) n=1 Tax=Tistlia consotensis USBA 355 TaxID=560819 RepID=A0A1Y6CRC8_9PROT|nr:multicopper oxidase family protein [Tistlia consotensis]SMF85290.1 Multicopper oxidase with three cupredoxin domains (includes cell division protein FtsP and spore coat protein CotA) [Tistlia consotensis USBA 355]SNS39295.1 Multicopper oxidase with three cupredoxin domains (includes cell division protein FtsP and spore coat protein CotA) [Tistlia consotensis]
MPPAPLTRRALLTGALAVGGLAAVGARPAVGERAVTTRLVAGQVARRLTPEQPQASRLRLYNGTVLPVLRLKKGQPVEITLENRLPDEHTTVHWHGLRIAHAMDGVPYITQPPVEPGESFTYRFAPPDAGTFFFHPHCNTVEQLGRGLAGVLVVEGDEARPFDADLVLAYKDWDLAPDGTLGPFLTLKGAANAGTFGSLTTVNGEVVTKERQPVFEVPAGADLRLRFLNLDNTRLLGLGLHGAEAWLVASDGQPLPPLELKNWRMGPAMRADLALRTPDRPGAVVEVLNQRAAKPKVLARLVTTGQPRRRAPFEPTHLTGPFLPEPQIEGAPVVPMVFSTAPGPSAPPPELAGLPFADALCLNPRTLWAINRQTWPQEGHAHPPAPLATLQRGRTYVLELNNISKHFHPIHLHGHSFKVFWSSDDAELPVHWADTTLVAPGERRRVAFVADNPGDWMFHCHIIEHQETGMMGLVRVA